MVPFNEYPAKSLKAFIHPVAPVLDEQAKPEAQVVVAGRPAAFLAAVLHAFCKRRAAPSILARVELNCAIAEVAIRIETSIHPGVYLFGKYLLRSSNFEN